MMDAVNDPRTHTVVFMTSAQIGKALCIETPIPTPSGWTRMGDLCPGDEVFDEAGRVCRVTFATPVMKDRECFRVVFSDGAEIIADAEHRWTVDVNNSSGQGIGTRTLTTREMLGDHRNGERTKYAIPLARPLETPDVELPLDPYFVGLWLGNGHSQRSAITFHVDDLEIYQSLESVGLQIISRTDKGRAANVVIDKPEWYNYSKEYCPRGHRRAEHGAKNGGGFNVCAKCQRQHSKTSMYPHLGDRRDPIVKPPTMSQRVREIFGGRKFIPREYLRASPAQRLALLQGLMDTDGTIAPNGSCEFVTTSKDLAEGFHELLSSLGIKAICKEKHPTCRYKGEIRKGALAYRFAFRGYQDFPVFRLGRKVARLRPMDNCRLGKSRRRRIVAIEPVPSVPVRCIGVDSPSHLFLAGRSMVPTHNSEVLLNILGFFVAHDPAPMLLLQPTLEMAEAFSKDRLAPMIRDTPAIRGKFTEARSKDSANTLLHKKFLGGHVTLSGGNSPASLASRPIRIVLGDEIDRLPVSAGTEGDPVSLAIKRTSTFYNRKIILCSTPTIKGQSRIEFAFEHSDQRHFHVACPECNAFWPLTWEILKFPEKNPQNAHLECPECRSRVDESLKPTMLRGGQWVAAADFDGTAGFHLNELYSPWRKWSEVVDDFLKAKQNVEQLKVWTNTSMGKTWELKGDAPEWERLYRRRETYEIGTVPDSVLFLVCGVDVQGDRLEYEVVGYGKDKQSWSIKYGVIHGNTHGEGPWVELEELLNQHFPRADGSGTLPIRMMGVDSGFNTQQVYTWTRKFPVSRVIATKGVQTAQMLIGLPTIVDVNKDGRRMARGARVFPLGVHLAKSELYSWLKLESPLNPEDPWPTGFCHFPQYDEEYFKMLTAEQLVTKFTRNGFPQREWQKTRERNEALDCRVIARACASLVGLDRLTPEMLEQVAGRVASHAPIERRQSTGILADPAPEDSPASGTIPRRRSTFL